MESAGSIQILCSSKYGFQPYITFSMNAY